jgi:hypothetical protein
MIVPLRAHHEKPTRETARPITAPGETAPHMPGRCNIGRGLQRRAIAFAHRASYLEHRAGERPGNH